MDIYEFQELKLGDITKINSSEYVFLDHEFIRRSQKMEKQYRLLGWPLITEFHFYHASYIPCAYTPDRETRINPKTGLTIKKKSLPKGYKENSKPEIISLFHFSPASCPNLKPFYSIVYCLCKRKDGEETNYYLSKHRVGECPWKE